MLSATCPAAAVQVVGTPYTHHQKCVLVDTPASETTRRITAFLGGLDLCAGRYDTPGHTLFRASTPSSTTTSTTPHSEQRWRKTKRLHLRLEQACV